MLRLVCLTLIVTSGLGSRAFAQTSPADLVGVYDIYETRNAPGDSVYVVLELTSRVAQARQDVPAFRYQASLRNGRSESGTWWIAGSGYLTMRPDGARRHQQMAIYDVNRIVTTCALRTRPVQQGQQWAVAPEQVFMRRACRPGLIELQANVDVSETDVQRPSM